MELFNSLFFINVFYFFELVLTVLCVPVAVYLFFKLQKQPKPPKQRREKLGLHSQKFKL